MPNTSGRHRCAGVPLEPKQAADWPRDAHIAEYPTGAHLSTQPVLTLWHTPCRSTRKEPDVIHTRHSTQETKVSHRHRRSKLAQYVDLADQGALLVFAVADITGPPPLTLTVQVVALVVVAYEILRG